jgi:hypothetical protein
MGKQGVGCNVEGDTETEVGRSLVHEAAETVLGALSRPFRREVDVELAEHVAWWESHVGYGCMKLVHDALILSETGMRTYRLGSTQRG